MGYLGATKHAITDDTVNHPIASVDSLETLLKASGDRSRLRILQILKDDAFGVLELCAVLSIKQSAMSHHLKVLAGANLVRSRREGNALFYRRALPDSCIASALFASLDAQPLPAKLVDGLQSARQHRAERSLAFFASNAQRFGAQQELISNIDDYRDAVNELIETAGIERRRALEIGPGEGQYLGDLAEQFTAVVALDNSRSMLEASKAYCTKQQLSNVTFIDASSAPTVRADLPPQTFDCIVANMVLHHNARPEILVSNAAKYLAKGGLFVVTELCEHEQDWVREAAGDVWLGISSGQLDKWSEENGLAKAQSSYTSLKNGFRIQTHSYLKN